MAGGDQGVGYKDQSFPGRNNDNGVDSLGVAEGTITDLNGGFGDVIAVIGTCRVRGKMCVSWGFRFSPRPVAQRQVHLVSEKARPGR